jgi:hypothetical protein
MTYSIRLMFKYYNRIFNFLSEIDVEFKKVEKYYQ